MGMEVKSEKEQRTFFVLAALTQSTRLATGRNTISRLVDTHLADLQRDEVMYDGGGTAPASG